MHLGRFFGRKPNSNQFPLISEKNTPIHVYLIRAGLTLSILLSLLALPRDYGETADSKTCRSDGGLMLIPGTIDLLSVNEIALPGDYWWEDSVSKLPTGYLISGIGFVDESSIITLRLFVEKDLVINEAAVSKSCFLVDQNSKALIDLKNIQFRYSTIIASE